MVDESIKSAFETALDDSIAIITEENTTAEELNNANKTLQDNIKTVQIEKSKYEIVKNKIAENITVATELTTADDFTNYGTEDEQNNLTSKLESATSVKSAETSTYTELNAANTELKSAIDAYITAIKEMMKEYIDVFEACLKGEGEYAVYKEYMTPAHEVQVEECVSEMNTLYNNPSATKAELVQEISNAEEIFLLLEQDFNTGYMISNVKQSLSTAIEKTESADITNLEYYPYFIQQNADETKTVFETELQTAKDTLSTFDATYTMESVTADNGASLNSVANLANSLNSKRTNLVNAQSYFVQYRSSTLPDAIETANTLMSSSDFTNYSTEEKRTAIETKADALSALLADNKSYYSDLKSAETNLQNAISAYRDDKSKKQEEELNAAKTALNETITTAQNIKNNNFYTYAPYPQFFSDESKKTTFEKALSDAEYLAARGYLMTVENCTAANNTLKNAIDDIKVESDNYINLKNQMKSTISTAETTVGYTDFDKCSTEEKRTALSSAISTAKGLDSKPYMSDLTSANQTLNDALNDYNTDRAKVVEDLNTTLEEQLVEINNLIDDEYYPYYITGKYTQNSLEVTKENISNYTTKYLEGDSVIVAREDLITRANATIQEATEQKSAYTSLKNELSELITSATAITSASDFADYSTEEHRTALTEALTAATNTNSSKTSTYQNLTDAKTTLNNALNTYNTDKESSEPAGLYDENDVLIKSWNELLNEGVIHVENGVLKSNYILEKGSVKGNTSSDALVGKLIIPSNNITALDTYAFAGCTGITSVKIPNNILNIGEGAFLKCTSLTSVNIPNGVTAIKNSTFNSCSKIASIDIPDSVTSIGERAFNCCTGLTSINIPDGVTSIGNYAFYVCNKLTSIDIPDSVTSIGDGAFNNCTILASINIPDSVTSIGTSVFGACSSLTSIKWPNNITTISDSIFSWSGLTSIEIPNGVISIGRYAFGSCSKLVSVILPDTLITIGDYAFDGDSKLSINVPNSVTSIGPTAMFGVKHITYHGTATGSPWGAASMN